jgi:hypothetical protein
MTVAMIATTGATDMTGKETMGRMNEDKAC